MIITLKRWIRRWKRIFFDLVSGIGIFWLFVEIASYSTNGQLDKHLKSVPLFVVVFLIIFFIATIKNKPKTCFGEYLRGKDNYLEVKVGDAFDNKGALVVPVNDEFDMSLGGNVAKANSIQNQLIKKYYSQKTEHLEIDIAGRIQMGEKFEIGKTIEI